MLASEVPPRLFLDEIHLELAACRVGGDSTVHAVDEVVELIDDLQHLYWIGPPPGPGERARALVDALRGRDLLAEPFERASVGLREAFDDGTNVVA